MITGEAPDGSPDGESRVFAFEIVAILALAGLLSYMFWTVAHV